MTELAEPEAFVVYRPGAISVEAPIDSKRSDERLRAIVTEHFDFVWRSLRRLGIPVADTDDAVQEVLLTFSRKLGSVETGRERAFLFAVALRVASTSRRSRARRPESLELDVLELESDDLGPEELVELAHARPLLDDLLNELTLEQRAVFVLHELEELEVGAIASLLDVPRGTVSWRLAEARRAFARAAERLKAKHAFEERRR